MQFIARPAMIDKNDKTQSFFDKIGSARLKKLGIYGFLFFLIKGLLWLIVPALLLYFGFGSD